MSLESERRGSGAANEASRRASGRALRKDLNSLVLERQRRAPLKAVAPRGAMVAMRGRADWVPPATGGAGIAGPLQETDVSARVYHPLRLVSTSDGLFTFREAPIEQVVLRDANGRDTEFHYLVEPTP
ncbi:hypothetical protein QMA71_04365 [Pseudomonas otitidis]|uniref:hypothetical protein n=1 Tax=Metapseudomonas otitidis TaxID=319939 RepID=UPI0024ACC87B|nr:hypothetical protein [Pseudomonas otitidis]MDI6524754.1 hypothetical protein [Pseudomonas otitidis]